MLSVTKVQPLYKIQGVHKRQQQGDLRHNYFCRSNDSGIDPSFHSR
jgi:hypothetical protein